MNESLLERFNQLSLREKTMVLATLIVVLWGILDTLIYQPLSTEKKQLSSELSTIQAQVSTQQQMAAEIESIGKINPNALNSQQLQAMKAEIKQLKQKVSEGDKQFVPAHLMTEVLGNILKQNSGLELVKLETLAVSTLSESDKDNNWVYRHGLSYTFSGNYFNTLNYLKALEALPWRFNWDSINYQVKEYPIAEVTLRVYTLSFEENWLGL